MAIQSYVNLVSFEYHQLAPSTSQSSKELVPNNLLLVEIQCGYQREKVNRKQVMTESYCK